VNFIGQPADSPMSRRAQEGLGVYGVKLFDFAREHGDQEVPDDVARIDPDIMTEDSDYFGSISEAGYSNRSVAVFVLDVRSNKSPWKKGREAFLPDYEGDFLGEQQWQWFETAIRRSQAAVNVVVSGLQFHADLYPDANVAESWAKLPRAQQRLFDALLQEGVQAPLLISGDVHMTQLMRKDCEKVDGSSYRRRSLVEMTTSGMTHTWGTVSSPPLSNPKETPSLRDRYGAFLSSTFMHVLHGVSQMTNLLLSDGPIDDLHPNGGGEGAKQGLQYSLEKNFGELEFDWDRQTVTMRSMGEQPDAPPLLMASWSLDQLSGMDEEIPGSLVTSQDFAYEVDHDAARFSQGRPASWVCLNHRGNSSFFGQMFGHLSVVSVLTILLPFPFLVPSFLMLLFMARKGKFTYRKSI